MNNHRKTGALRLWALVLFFVAVAPVAFAQQIDASFPFLSVDPAQAQSLWGAFKVQWYLFSSFNNGAVPAMYYVALAAAMVGALGIVFNAKSQDFKTIAAWLLITVICLFAPYNSKLLFYGIDEPSPDIGVGARTTSEQQIIKGFTPQLVAAHIGTTLQVIFVDLFSKVGGMQSMIDIALSQVYLSSTPLLDPGGGWLGSVNNYLGECGSSGGGILPASILEANQQAAMSGGGVGGQQGGQDAMQAPSITFKDALDSIHNTYGSTEAGHLKSDFSVPPPLIELYTSPEQIKGSESEYFIGLSALYNKLYSNDKNELVITNVEQMRDATTRILADVSAARGATGSILTYIKPYGEDSSPAVTYAGQMSSCRSNEGWSPTVLLRTLGAVWTCDRYISSYRDGVTQKGGSAECLGVVECSQLHRFSSLDSALSKMPVSMRVLGGKTAYGQSAPVSHSIDSLCDIQRGDALFQAAFNNTWLSSGFEPLKQMIETGQGIPSGNVTWTPQMLMRPSFSDLDGSKTKLATELATRLNGNQDFNLATSTLDKQKILAQVVIGHAKQSAGVNSKSDASLASAKQFNEMRPSNIGALAGPAGWLASVGGEAITRLASIFASATAVAIIYFLRVMIDIAMMGVIVLTPVAMLVGIAIPSHAFGILVQSFMVIGILKLVPVTFVIVDRVGSFVYGTIGAVGGEEQKLREALFLFAIAGIYAGLVGMTMFLLFKIGDPQNISKLTELDKAAEQAADAGMKLAKALATAAAGAMVVRPVLGAISGWKAGGQQAESDDFRRGELGKENTAENEGRDYNPPTTPVVDGDPSPPPDGSGSGGIDPTSKAFGFSMPSSQTSTQQTTAQSIAQATINNQATAQSTTAQANQTQTNGTTTVQANNNQIGNNGALAASPDVDVEGDVQKIKEAGDMQAAHHTGQASDVRNARAEGTAKRIHEIKAINERAGLHGVHAYSGTRNLYNEYEKSVNDARKTALAGVDKNDPNRKEKVKWINAAAAKDMADLNNALSKEDHRGLSQVNAIADFENWSIRKSGLGNRFKMARSGAWGSLKTGFGEGVGALGSIPVVGDMLKPHFDELYQGGARALAKQGSGKDWNTFMKRQKQAKYQEYFDKEIGVQEKGMLYENNLSSGVYFNSGRFIAAERAAAEASSKSVADIRASVAARPKEGYQYSDFMSAHLVGALDSLNKTMQQAIAIQKGQFDLAAGGSVRLTDAVLQRMSAGGATWAASKPVADLFEGHLKGIDKDMTTLRDKKIDISGRVRGDKEAIAKAVSMDMGKDYADLYELNIEKKANFFAQAEQAKAIRGMMNIENAMKKKYPHLAEGDNRWHLPVARIIESAKREGQIRGLRRSYDAGVKEEPVEHVKRSAKIPVMAARYDSNPKAVEKRILDALANGPRITPSSDPRLLELGKAMQNQVVSMRKKAGLANPNDMISFRSAIREVLEDLGYSQDEIDSISSKIR